MSPTSAKLEVASGEESSRPRRGEELKDVAVKSVTAAQGMRRRPWIRRHRASPHRRSSPRGEGASGGGRRGASRVGAAEARVGEREEALPAQAMGAGGWWEAAAWRGNARRRAGWREAVAWRGEWAEAGAVGGIK
jgi:hypothetical protein